MSKTLVWLIAATIISLCAAQSSSAQVNNSNAQHPPQAKVRQEPCWQKVGISKDVIEQRDAITRDTRSQVEAVCADGSLTPQQKKQKIHEIRQESKQKVGGLISEQQQEELQTCQRERAADHPAPPAVHHGGNGPCGELTSPGGAHAQGSAQNPGEESR